MQHTNIQTYKHTHTILLINISNIKNYNKKKTKKNIKQKRIYKWSDKQAIVLKFKCINAYAIKKQKQKQNRGKMVQKLKAQKKKKCHNKNLIACQIKILMKTK